MPGPEPWEYAWEREMGEQLSNLREVVCAGQANDYAEYKQLCGQIRGIQNSMDELKRIRQRLGNPDGDVDLGGGGL